MEFKSYDHIVSIGDKCDFDADLETIKTFLQDQSLLEDFRRFNAGEMKVTIPDTRLVRFDQPNQIDFEGLV